MALSLSIYRVAFGGEGLARFAFMGKIVLAHVSLRVEIKVTSSRKQQHLVGLDKKPRSFHSLAKHNDD